MEKALDGWSVVRFNGHTYIERIDEDRRTDQVGGYTSAIYNRSVSIVHDPDCTGKHPSFAGTGGLGRGF